VDEGLVYIIQKL